MVRYLFSVIFWMTTVISTISCSCHFDKASFDPSTFLTENGTRCEIVIGDVHISGYKDTRQLKSLIWVKELHGSVKIQSNSFSAINFLYRLEKIHIKSGPALQITSNSHLKHIDLPRLTEIIYTGQSSQDPAIIIEKNDDYQVDEDLRSHLKRHFKSNQLRLQYAKPDSRSAGIMKQLGNEFMKTDWNIKTVYFLIMSTVLFILTLTHFYYCLMGYCNHRRMRSYWPGLSSVQPRTYREEYHRIMTEYNEIQLSLGNFDNLQPLDLTNAELFNENTVAQYERIVRRQRRQEEDKVQPREEVLSDDEESQLGNSFLENGEENWMEGGQDTMEEKQPVGLTVGAAGAGQGMLPEGPKLVAL